MMLHDFDTRFLHNAHIDDEFMGNVLVHMPCLFCAAPDFIVYEILSVGQAVTRGGVCRECKRGARAIIDDTDGVTQYHWVQTSGKDSQPWHLHQMPRLT